MKEKIITIKPKGISQKQWASFLLELNLMKKANKKRNPVAKQLRHFKQKVIKNKKIYDRKIYKTTRGDS